MGEEITEFKHQLNSIKHSFNELKLSDQTPFPGALSQKIQNFSNQVQSQQQQLAQQLQQSIHQTMNVLNQLDQRIKMDYMFTQVDQAMDQAQNQLIQILKQNQKS